MTALTIGNKILNQQVHPNPIQQCLEQYLQKGHHKALLLMKCLISTPFQAWYSGRKRKAVKPVLCFSLLWGCSYKSRKESEVIQSNNSLNSSHKSWQNCSFISPFVQSQRVFLMLSGESVVFSLVVSLSDWRPVFKVLRAANPLRCSLCDVPALPYSEPAQPQIEEIKDSEI